jgi:hypothetical protein
MRLITTPVLLGVCLLGPGCSFVHNIKRNIIHEPLLAMDEKIILKRHERLGRLAWDEMVGQYGCHFSDDYRNGFIDGFVDYLTYGGCPSNCGETPVLPPVPPPKYRRAKAMSPEGLRAAEEWLMGFRHGSSTAMASGLRQLVVVPVFDRPIAVTDPRVNSDLQRPTMPGAADQGQTLPPPTPSEGEQLPPPRPAAPADGGPQPATPPPPNPMPPAGPAVPPG